MVRGQRLALMAGRPPARQGSLVASHEFARSSSVVLSLRRGCMEVELRPAAILPRTRMRIRTQG
jgi:hypothetical protein